MSALDYRKEHVKKIGDWCNKLEAMQSLLYQLPVLDESTDIKKQDVQDNIKLLEKSMYQRLSRVKQDTARVSVIGLEKQGKSTFVNAWIGKQCLPSDTQRCTWASSTLINDTEYYAKVSFLSREKFDETVDGLFTALNKSRSSIGFPIPANIKEREDIAPLTGNPAFKDLEQLSQHYSEIQSHLNKPAIEIREDNLDNFNSRLFEWVSLRKKEGGENGKAYAVEHCNIHLPIADNLLFSVDDLPGIDAPGNRAEKMTWTNVENNADIIVLVKNAFNNASLNNNEIKMWDKAEQSDSAVKLTDRLFIALNQADADKSENGRNCHTEAFNEFRGRNVAENRIFYVSSRAEVYCSAEDKSTLSFDDWTDEDQVKATEGIAKKRQQPKPTTGFPEFKEAMYRFIENDLQVLEEKALRYLEEKYQQQSKIFKDLVAIYKDAEGSESTVSEAARDRFGELWLPQDRVRINKEGLGNKIKTKIGLLLSELNTEKELTADFLAGIREEIHQSRDRMLQNNTLEAFEAEYSATASSIINYESMRQTYFERVHGETKDEIFKNLSAAISQNINGHIKAIWDQALAEPTEQAPNGLLAIGEANILEFLKKKQPDALFSNLDNNEVGKVPYGFAALLKSIAHADLEYLISTNPKLSEQRAKILYKAKLYQDGITTSSQVGWQLRSEYESQLGNGATHTSALKVTIDKFQSNNTLVRQAVDFLLPKPYKVVAGFLLNNVLNGNEKPSQSEQGKASPPKEAAGNPFAAPSNRANSASVASSSKAHDVLVDRENDVSPESVVHEIEQRIKLVYYVLEAMLFDDDFGMVGYYRAIMEEFRLLIEDEIAKDGGAIKSLALNYRELVFPDEPLFKRDNRKEQMQRIFAQLESLAL